MNIIRDFKISCLFFRFFVSFRFAPPFFFFPKNTNFASKDYNGEKLIRDICLTGVRRRFSGIASQK